MLFNVPQYIDVEDKVAGPFTAKQLFWMFGMGAVLLVLWGFLEKGAFFMAAIPIGIIFCALAFYRPQGQPLIRFIIWGVGFAFQPKVYMWKREYNQKKKALPVENQDSKAQIRNKEENKHKILTENIESFSRTLDTEGRERNEKIMEIIRQNKGTIK